MENFKSPARPRWSRVIEMTELESQEIPGQEWGQELGSGKAEGSHLEMKWSGSDWIPFLNSSKDRRSEPEVKKKSRERVKRKVERVI